MEVIFIVLGNFNLKYFYCIFQWNFLGWGGIKVSIFRGKETKTFSNLFSFKVSILDSKLYTGI